VSKAILISCGDPAGVGPEVAAKAYAALAREVVMAYVGDPRHLPDNTPTVHITHPDEAAAAMATGLPVLAHPFSGNSAAAVPDPTDAADIIEVIARCVRWVQNGDAAALCTAPINKKVLQDGAGFAYPGHTEYLEALATGDTQAVMMLASDALRVVPATIHIALEDVPTALTPQLLRSTIEITAQALRDQFGLPKPRLAVAGLNPHAGEGGKMGRAELDWIAPLLEQMRGQGYDLSGPLPADTMFHAAARARYDAAVCMYHDQALIPIKTLDFDKGVNVTLGLPFVRTSPDHGTAYDIAGQGIANPTSMIEALKLAQRLATRQST
jgi:4-hydroxythreonine-4-phosphate dehydrogenase